MTLLREHGISVTGHELLVQAVSTEATHRYNPCCEQKGSGRDKHM